MNALYPVTKLSRAQRKLFISLGIVLVSLLTLVTLIELQPQPQSSFVAKKRWFSEQLTEYDEDSTVLEYEFE